MAENLLVRFWMDAYPNTAKTKDTGRPVYDTVPWCEIKVPGERDTVSGPVHRMTPDPRSRFAEAWARFERDNATEGLTGTPLRDVPWLGRGEVETLAYDSIKTLEQLASVSDANITRIPGGLALRQRAKDAIKAAQDDAPVQRMAEELAKRDAEIASLKAQIGEILGSEPKRRGRPPKQAEE